VLSFDQLQSFAVVAEELHFGRAAERLSVTQPSLSRRIQALEAELGVELFLRSHRRVTLTPAGSAFLTDARRLLRLSEEATTSVRRVPSGQVGTISIGFTAAAAYSYLGQLLEVAAVQLPEVEIVLREMVSDLQVEALHDGSIDLGLVRPPVRGPDVRSVRVVSEPMLAAVPSTHPAATAGRLAAKDLHGRPFVMYWPTGSRYFHDLLRAAFATARIEPDVRQFVTQVHTALALVRAGVGLALVPSAAQTLHFDGVVLIPVDGFGELRAELELVWRPDDLNPARDALISALRPQPRRTARRLSPA
jgi:DNA-binding transcriptional LysR family regulator